MIRTEYPKRDQSITSCLDFAVYSITPDGVGSECQFTTGTCEATQAFVCGLVNLNNDDTIHYQWSFNGGYAIDGETNKVLFLGVTANTQQIVEITLVVTNRLGQTSTKTISHIFEFNKK